MEDHICNHFDLILDELNHSHNRVHDRVNQVLVDPGLWLGGRLLSLGWLRWCIVLTIVSWWLLLFIITRHLDAIVKSNSTLLTPLVPVRLIRVCPRDLIAHVVRVQLGHKIVRLIVVVRYADLFNRINWTDANGKVFRFLVDIGAHVKEVILLGHHFRADNPLIL